MLLFIAGHNNQYNNDTVNSFKFIDINYRGLMKNYIFVDS